MTGPGGLELIGVEQPSERLAAVVLSRPPANALSHQFMDELGAVTAWLEPGETQLVVLRSDAPNVHGRRRPEHGQRRLGRPGRNHREMPGR